MERLAGILKRIFRWAIIITSLAGAWYAYWAPGGDGVLVLMIYVVAAIILWSVGRVLQFILVRR